MLFVLGFLGLTLGSVDVFLTKWRDYAWLSNDSNTLFQWSSEPMFRAIGYFVMFLFALFSMRKIKKHLGGIVRYLWIIPGIILVLAYTKLVADSNVLIACRRVFNPQWIGLKKIPREVLDAAAHLFVIAAVFFSAFCFRRISCRPAGFSRQETYAQPNPPYAPPAQPQSAPRYTASEPPKQPEPAPKANGQNIQEQIQACKDLLECGLLTQAEYEQKIRELTREYNGG
ncbi:MAG: SHOCT domain-containing protein [Clostridia bacterium]|nr:SHOCT domain-containing protein [Clostridia bacterium]